MATTHDSFDASAHGSFIQSPHGWRGTGTPPPGTEIECALLLTDSYGGASTGWFLGVGRGYFVSAHQSSFLHSLIRDGNDAISAIGDYRYRYEYGGGGASKVTIHKIGSDFYSATSAENTNNIWMGHSVAATANHIYVHGSDGLYGSMGITLLKLDRSNMALVGSLSCQFELEQWKPVRFGKWHMDTDGNYLYAIANYDKGRLRKYTLDATLVSQTNLSYSIYDGANMCVDASGTIYIRWGDQIRVHGGSSIGTPSSTISMPGVFRVFRDSAYNIYGVAPHQVRRVTGSTWTVNFPNEMLTGAAVNISTNMLYVITSSNHLIKHDLTTDTRVKDWNLSTWSSLTEVAA